MTPDVRPDAATDTLLRRLQTFRRHGVQWTWLSLALGEAIAGDVTTSVHRAFVDFHASGHRWDDAYRVIADGWQLEKVTAAATASGNAATA